MTTLAGTVRYSTRFDALAARREGAFVPFAVVGDPHLEASRRVLRALAESGADALELGLPFSDPIADGPTVQSAVVRALDAGVTPEACWPLIAEVRRDFPDLPIGLLVYANLVVNRGIERFYRQAAEAGVDSVLVADVPHLEAAPFLEHAHAAGVASVFIAPPNASEAQLAWIASHSEAYTYVLTRSGVTGADATLPQQGDVPGRLKALHAPPALLGFGISQPEHVRAALQAGAAGAISGSAVVSRVGEHKDDLDAMEAALRKFVSEMKAATIG
ncbi:MAG: tryptophan synthase subunit alpha [Candidatus Xenobia bacterium]